MYYFTYNSDFINSNRRKSRTSAVLTNAKALLFSKDKGIIAIPINKYNEDFEIGSTNNKYSSIINSYKKSYLSEGYFVHTINIENMFKGIIINESINTNYNKL